jgi:NADPH-dependent F420 reductase
MKVGIVGGTGKEGSGLAIRWARAGHEVRIGSRDGARGEARAVELSEQAGATISGGDNASAVAHGEVVVMSVPYKAHKPTYESVRELVGEKTIVDITVPLQPPKVREVHLPEGQSAALEARAILGEGAHLVAALHHVSSVHLGDPDHDFDCDVLVCSDHGDARDAVISLIGDLGMRALDAGPLRNAVALESLTPVLLYLNKKYKAHSGLRITGVE